MPTRPLPPTPVLLDGGMGRELRFRGVEILTSIWSANGLVVAPDVVRDIHRDYIAAGADVITTNTYGIIRQELAKEGIAHRFAELNDLACRLAVEARDEATRDVWIAGSLPPLNGSYRPDRVLPWETIVPLYAEQAALLAPHVDLFLCETMSSAAEGLAAATAACATGKPVWISYTLHDDHSGRLRSGESVAEAVRALGDLPVSGILANCCPPESITASGTSERRCSATASAIVCSSPGCGSGADSVQYSSSERRSPSTTSTCPGRRPRTPRRPVAVPGTKPSAR